MKIIVNDIFDRFAKNKRKIDFIILLINCTYLFIIIKIILFLLQLRIV